MIMTKLSLQMRTICSAMIVIKSNSSSHLDLISFLTLTYMKCPKGTILTIV